MEQKEIDEIISSSQEIINQASDLQEELNMIKHSEEFLINEYHTNKRYFKNRLESGRCTIEDVIKTVFEFAWSASKNYIHRQNNKNN